MTEISQKLLKEEALERRTAMFWSRICAVTIALMMLFGSGINFTLAGEKIKTKASGTSINTKWHEIEVGDTEGHVVAVFENTQVWVSEISGERVTAQSRGTMDLQKQSGQGTMKGYSVMTWKSGDQRFGSFEGQIVGKGQWAGTYTDIDGTGKYKGCSGGGTWKTQSLGRGISHIEAEGERIFQ